MKASRSFGKNLVSLGILAGLGAAPALAHAAPSLDHYVEIQYDARAFGEILQRRIGTMSDFCPQGVEIDGVGALVDHIEIHEHGELSHADPVSAIRVNDFAQVDGHSVLYRQPIELHLKNKACIQDPECSTTEASSAELVYELFTGPQGEICMRSYASHGLPDGFDAPQVKACLPFNADYVLQAAGLSDQAVSGSAVTLAPDGGRVALRVEMGVAQSAYDSERLDAWQAFVDGDLQSTGAIGDWSLFAHKSLILGGVERHLSETLLSQAGFTLDGPIETTWEAGETEASIDANANGVLTNGYCPEGVHVTNIHLRGHVGADDSGTPSGLTISGGIDYNVSAQDAAACGLALGGPVGALVFSAMSQSITVDMPHLGPNCEADGDYGFVCREPVRSGLSSIGPLQSMTSLFGGMVVSPQGLAINAKLQILGEDQLTSQGHVSDFDLREQDQAYSGMLALRGTGRVCDVRFSSDKDGDLDLFTIRRTRDVYPTYEVALPLDHVSTFEDHPFHVMALVMTSAGSRMYRLDPAASLP